VIEDLYPWYWCVGGREAGVRERKKLSYFFAMNIVGKAAHKGSLLLLYFTYGHLHELYFHFAYFTFLHICTGRPYYGAWPVFLSAHAACKG